MDSDLAVVLGALVLLGLYLFWSYYLMGPVRSSEDADYNPWDDDGDPKP